ncbi:DUF3997 domain-containing protein [Ectobacillus ponti]|uniref:DUF3997 domain-containing protein n=1 Tax=Ectobacillus ponti TaxID=2961894 RepID=A0AA41XDF9_9BACI|nr:DUF3997 domain-containing protein [Ectobacillus ponti]MCP8970860.1 DUF3997 domain-containing protein [Ectobacillus ponti]
MLKRLMLPVLLVLLTGCSSAISEYKLGSDYMLRQASIVPQMDALHASQLIPSTVTEVAWDDNYILAKQQLADENSANPDASLNKAKREQYWIIDIRHDKRYGPYNEKQFEEQKKEFNITEALQLQSISTYTKS